MAPSSPWVPFQKNWICTAECERSSVARAHTLNTRPHGDSGGASVPNLRTTGSACAGVEPPRPIVTASAKSRECRVLMRATLANADPQGNPQSAVFFGDLMRDARRLAIVLFKR